LTQHYDKRHVHKQVQIISKRVKDQNETIRILLALLSLTYTFLDRFSHLRHTKVRLSLVKRNIFDIKDDLLFKIEIKSKTKQNMLHVFLCLFFVTQPYVGK